MMVKKSFFNERTVKEIERLGPERVFRERGLVEKIANLNPDNGLELRLRLTPGNFFAGNLNGSEASRKAYKHGDFIALSQPTTQQEAYTCLDTPMAIITSDFGVLKNMREEEIDFMGYSFRPVQGRDRTKRVVPFIWIYEAHRIYAYAENAAGGILLQPYVDSNRVKKEGGEIICSVPSRTKKQPRYKIRLKHLPIESSPERKSIAWSFKANYENKEPGHSLYNIKYNWENDRESSDVITIYPQEIAANFRVIKHFFDQNKTAPWEMNPFFLVSKEGIEYYKKLCNNVLIYDPSLEKDDKRRKLHIDEKCILLVRGMGILGPEKMMWNYSRDGKTVDYDWSIPGKR